MKPFPDEQEAHLGKNAPPGHDSLAATTGDRSPINIRRMRLEDIERVHELDVLSFSLPWPYHSYRFELLENPNSLQWVAETWVEGQPLVVGMLVMWLLLDEAHIATIAVHPDFRRRGIGRQLMCTALSAGRAQGAVSATLEVRQHNTGAIRLYEQLGFENVGCRPRYYQDTQEDAIIMTLHDLAGALERLGQPNPGKP